MPKDSPVARWAWLMLNGQGRSACQHEKLMGQDLDISRRSGDYVVSRPWYEVNDLCCSGTAWLLSTQT